MGTPRFLTFTGLAASDSCTSTESSIFSPPSNHETHSSPAETASSEGTSQATPNHDIHHSGTVGLQDGVATPTELTDESKLQCLAPECANVSFKGKRELRRHAKKHDPNATLWYCGCCRNLGLSDKANTRRDGIRRHLRKDHETSRPEGEGRDGIKSIECPVDDCHTLFTAPLCLDTHLEKWHPGQSKVMPTKTDNGSTCDCSKEAEAESLTYSRQFGANKHKAESTLESSAKRGKYDTEIFRPLSVTPDLCTGIAPSQSSFSGFDLAFMNQSGYLWPDGGLFVDSIHRNQNITDGKASSETAPTYMYPESNIPYPLTYPAVTAPSTRPLVYQLVLDEIRPADLFALLKIHGFRTRVAQLRASNDENIDARISAVAYNPQRKTITLTGFPEEAVKRAKEALQNLLATYSERWGRKFLEKPTFDPQFESSESPRARTLHSSSDNGDGISEQQKRFPIKPKDHRRLVGMWFKHILPALPKILDERLVGGTYTASLVRRGQIDIRAEPYIEIESPRIPGPKAQRIIEDLLNDMCAKDSQDPIRVHFSHGSIKKLSGGGEKVGENDVPDSNDDRRYQFNMARPYSKLRMGASLGLLCSKKVSGTLGGYVLVDGKKYMLTSDHFIARSREPESGDGDDSDLETLTSPSRFDLGWLELNLQQTSRDLSSEFDRQLLNQYGDQAVPIDKLCDRHTQSPEIAKTINAMARIETLIDQVKKPLTEYVIGEVFKNSSEPRTAAISKPLADIARLPQNQRLVKYHMDWSLCKLNGQENGSGESFQGDRHENRHKYRSESDARADDYTEEEETNQKDQAGDVCYQTCPVESGSEVYYVGQGSNYRSGLVTVPCLVSRNYVKTFDWAIVSSDGQEIRCSDVEGDSGSWVIRRNGNMLMGQIHSYTSGQVLFTPIDVIFDDIAQACETKVSLPHPSLDPEPATEASQLCSMPKTPPIQSLDFLKPRYRLGATTAERSPMRTPLKIPKCEPLIAGQSNSVNTKDQVSQSPESDWSLSELSQPLDGSDLSIAQGDLKRLQSKSVSNLASEYATTEIPGLILDEQSEAQRLDLASYKSQVRSWSTIGITSATRTTTWPTGKEGKVKKRQIRLRCSPTQLSRFLELTAVLYSALVHLKGDARGTGGIEHLEAMVGFPNRKARMLPGLENASKRMKNPVLSKLKAASRVYGELLVENPKELEYGKRWSRVE